MSYSKRVVVGLPDALVRELDSIAKRDGSNRSDTIRTAVKFFLQERKKKLTREMMQRGYMEMAKINLSISTESLLAEEEAEDTLYKLVSGV